MLSCTLFRQNMDTIEENIMTRLIRLILSPWRAYDCAHCGERHNCWNLCAKAAAEYEREMQIW